MFDSPATLAQQESNQFLQDVWQGLSSKQKYLESKYFYDENGDVIFQKIMDCSDYYLTRCEMDILKNKTAELAFPITAPGTPFDLIELGAGDASKTYFLLKHLLKSNADFVYKPIDISGHILDVLEDNLSQQLPNLKVAPCEGDYFQALDRICQTSNRRKIVLFLGSNIGNMQLDESESFCQQMAHHLNPGDFAIVGFDLKKNPKTILKAYDDDEGVTSEFNLNLLHRINRDLDGNFDLKQFEHYQNYDPLTGACRSFLVSLTEQTVTIAGRDFYFAKDEAIYMEVSQKYSPEDIDELAERSGFKTVSHCYDHKKWYMDAIWKVI
ncbi:L-histidine N(alpha)-methyltransferase [Gayadomonas joobiniege]|uniref:L-histidine N(alpha)-methyltransferase n=1 Tax=Gayadomonas joobiniege TaxID=1234606 RepID=UPI00035C4423|nr:L-histidine N(alpha)-methyltransferase [Gayadomonas joobiniege]